MDTMNALKASALVYRIKKGNKWGPVRVYLHETEAGRDKFLYELRFIYKDNLEVIQYSNNLAVMG